MYIWLKDGTESMDNGWIEGRICGLYLSKKDLPEKYHHNYLYISMDGYSTLRC